MNDRPIMMDLERMKLREINAKSHTDITDRFGRVWVWKARDLYTHDGVMAFPSGHIEHPDMQLPHRSLKGNPNYAGLCSICRSEW